jgi:hypothetical protein
MERGERDLPGELLPGRHPEGLCWWSWWTEAEGRTVGGVDNDEFGRQPF